MKDYQLEQDAYASPSLQRILSGYQRYRQDFYPKHKQLFSDLADFGQAPKVCMVTCCDARIRTTHLLDVVPGDLFEIRNVANIIPPYEAHSSYHGTSAALQFAVCYLSIEHFIILGHRHCGGIRALFEKNQAHDIATEESYIEPWLSLLDETKTSIDNDFPDATIEEKIFECEKRAVLVSLSNCLTFPWIRSRLQKSLLHLHAWIFDVKTGRILAYDYTKSDFVDIETLTEGAKS